MWSVSFRTYLVTDRPQSSGRVSDLAAVGLLRQTQQLGSGTICTGTAGRAQAGLASEHA